MLIDQKELLENSPLAILLCDKASRIIWSNPLFLAQTKLAESQVINQLYSSLPIQTMDCDRNSVQFFSAQLNEPINFHYWLSPSTSIGGGTIHYFLLEEKVEPNQSHLKDKINNVNLPKRANWLEFLNYEISRSRRYDNPLSVLKLHLLILDNPNNICAESIQQQIKSILMDELRWADMIGRTENGSYLIVLPETPSQAIMSLQQKLDLTIRVHLTKTDARLNYQLVFADACWRKNDDVTKLLNRARVNLVEQLEKLLLANTK